MGFETNTPNQPGEKEVGGNPTFPEQHPNWEGPEMTQIRQISANLEALKAEKDKLFAEFEENFPAQRIEREIQGVERQLEDLDAKMKELEKSSSELVQSDNFKHGDKDLARVSAEADKTRRDIKEYKRELETLEDKKERAERLEEIPQEMTDLQAERRQLAQSPAVQAIFDESSASLKTLFTDEDLEGMARAERQK